MGGIYFSVSVLSNIPAIVARAHAKAEDAVAKAAHDIEARAKANAPVDTGALRAAIKASGGGLSWRVDSPVHYSIYQEFGTSKMAAHPYLIPATEAVQPSFVQAMTQIVS